MKTFLTMLLFSSLITPFAFSATQMGQLKENQIGINLNDELANKADGSFIGDGVVEQIPKIVAGDTFGEINGVYIDTSNDVMKPRERDFPDRTISYSSCEKDKAYKLDESDLTMDFKNTLAKEAFLKTSKHVTFDVQIANNTWNSSNKWTNKQAKKSTFKRSTVSFDLKGEHQRIQVVDFKDSHHHNNEETYLAITENWRDNVLDLQINCFCWVHWSGKKHAQHAAFIQWKMSSWTFSNGKSTPSRGEKVGNIRFTSRGVGSYELPINNVFSEAHKMSNQANNLLSVPLSLVMSFTTIVQAPNGQFLFFELFFALPYVEVLKDLTKTMTGEENCALGAKLTFDISSYDFVAVSYSNLTSGAHTSAPHSVPLLAILRGVKAVWKGTWALSYLTYKMV